jgi:5,10-methylenetetrahydrofolate reductase
MKPLCSGVHIMAIGWEKKVPLVLESANLIWQIEISMV